MIYSSSDRGPEPKMFDAVVDRSALGETDVKSFLAKFSTISYTRPEEHVGVNAVSF